MDYMNQKDFSDFNTIIYGHHMDGGAMFGDFDQYLDQSFADSHLYGNIFTNGKDYGLELFAFLELDAYNTGLYVTPVQEVSRKEQYLQEIEDTALWYRQISLSTEEPAGSDVYVYGKYHKWKAYSDRKAFKTNV